MPNYLFTALDLRWSLKREAFHFVKQIYKTKLYFTAQVELRSVVSGQFFKKVNKEKGGK